MHEPFLFRLSVVIAVDFCASEQTQLVYVLWDTVYRFILIENALSFIATQSDYSISQIIVISIYFNHIVTTWNLRCYNANSSLNTSMKCLWKSSVQINSSNSCERSIIVWLGSSVAKCGFIKTYRYFYNILMTFGDRTVRQIY